MWSQIARLMNEARNARTYTAKSCSYQWHENITPYYRELQVQRELAAKAAENVGEAKILDSAGEGNDVKKIKESNAVPISENELFESYTEVLTSERLYCLS
jgi:hypothetical protein